MKSLIVKFATWLLNSSHWYCKKFDFFFPNRIKCADIYEDECFPCTQYAVPCPHKVEPQLDGQDK